jgi:protein-disulfide isomerase
MSRRPLALACLALAALLVTGAGPAGDGERTPLAVVDGEILYVEDVRGTAAFRIYRHELDIHSLLRSEAERRVEALLLEREARRRGTSVEAMLGEVLGEAPEVSDAEVERYLAEHPAEATAAPEEARARVRHYLGETRRLERRIAFLASLHERAGYRFLLEPPEPPRTTVPTEGAVARGPADAPLQVVHFASFGSRSSARSAAKLSRLMQEFPGGIRWVHRNLLSDRDERGLRAARLGFLAQDAERFWPLHDAWFARMGKLDAEAIESLAQDAGLSRQEIERAPTDATLLRRVKRDLDAANDAGAPREPSLFVNGRYVPGLLEYEELRDVFREELRRAEGD